MTRALTLPEAAAELRKTPRWLKDWLAKNPVDETGLPFYVPMGRTLTFDPADIKRIRANFGRDIKRESVVYFFATCGYIKIGWTSNWRRRLIYLQVGSPEPLQILLIIGRPKIYEKTMHAKFSQHWAHGEWFRAHPISATLLTSMNTNVGRERDGFDEPHTRQVHAG